MSEGDIRAYKASTRRATRVQVGYTDIDQLERVVHILAHGDLQAENTRQLTETNFIKIFRLAQLAIQYLLHVQDVLSSERSELLKTECVSHLGQRDAYFLCSAHGRTMCIVTRIKGGYQHLLAYAPGMNVL